MKITIHNLNEATEQQVFDTVSAHLLRQKSRSMLYTEKTCAYRSEDGKACAAGCLIPLEDYEPQYERNSWAELVLKHRHLPTSHQNFLSRLQRVHDSVEPEDWALVLTSVAKSCGLETNQEFTSLVLESKEFFNGNLS